jgi:hypothetical protein
VTEVTLGPTDAKIAQKIVVKTFEDVQAWSEGERSHHLEEDFPAQVDLFKARTSLSILYYLAKVQMGNSEEFRRILVEAERRRASVAARPGAEADTAAPR